MRDVRLTRRGWIVLLTVILSASFVVGLLTARWNWYTGWTP